MGAASSVCLSFSCKRTWCFHATRPLVQCKQQQLLFGVCNWKILTVGHCQMSWVCSQYMTAEFQQSADCKHVFAHELGVRGQRWSVYMCTQGLIVFVLIAQPYTHKHCQRPVSCNHSSIYRHKTLPIAGPTRKAEAITEQCHV